MITEQVQPTADQDAATVTREVGAAWREVLSKEASGPEADFFDAGGNSMLLLAMLELLQKRLGVEIAVDDLADGVTPGRLMRLAQQATAQA